MNTSGKNANWIFPDVDIYSGLDLSDMDSVAVQKRTEGLVNDLNITIKEKTNEVIQLQNQLEELKLSYEENMNNICNIVEKINHEMPKIDNHLKERVHHGVRNCIEQILNKTLTTYPDCLHKLINNYLEELKINSIVEVELSEQDYNLIKDLKYSEFIHLSINNNIDQGGFVINYKGKHYLKNIDNEINQILAELIYE